MTGARQLAEIPAEPVGDGRVHELGLGGLRSGLDAGLRGEGVPHSGNGRQADAAGIAVPLA